MRKNNLNSLQTGNRVRFVAEYLRHPLTTGSLIPSSSVLARQMTQAVLSYGDQHALVIEAGAGNGAVTEKLAAALLPSQHLVVCEHNARLTRLLQQRLPHVPIHRCPVQHLPHWAEKRSKTIVSSLPFRSLPQIEADEISAIFLQQLLNESNSVLIQFSYGLRNPVERLANHPAIESFCQSTVWRNFPPARVWVYRSVPRR